MKILKIIIFVHILTGNSFAFKECLAPQSSITIKALNGKEQDITFTDLDTIVLGERNSVKIVRVSSDKIQGILISNCNPDNVTTSWYSWIMFGPSYSPETINTTIDKAYPSVREETLKKGNGSNISFDVMNEFRHQFDIYGISEFDYGVSLGLNGFLKSLKVTVNHGEVYGFLASSPCALSA